MTFDGAREAINTAIKENGAGEITGPVLNTVLNTIVDATEDTFEEVDRALQEIIGE